MSSVRTGFCAAAHRLAARGPSRREVPQHPLRPGTGESFATSSDAEPPHPAVQVASIGLQQSGGFGDVAVRRRHRAADQFSFHVVEPVRQAAPVVNEFRPVTVAGAAAAG